MDRENCVIWGCGSIIVVFILALLIISPLVAYRTKTEVTAKVNKSERVVNQDSSGGKYLIFTESEVLENTDSLWYWKWNSSDFYNKIEVGKTYKFTVYGWRVPFMSWYRNIVEVEQTN